MDLSVRLQGIKDFVEKTGCAADIGCDHGYISMALTLDETADHVIACDINKGPLERAEINVKEAGLSEKIETRLSDGLNKIKAEDSVETLIIAGMGGRLMMKILSDRMDIVTGVKQMVLQPQSEINLVRKWIYEQGFHIEKERILKDAGKYYFILDVRPGQAPKEPEDLIEIYYSFSKYLIDKKDPLLVEYLERNLSNNLTYLKGIEVNKQEKLLSENKRIEYALSLMK